MSLLKKNISDTYFQEQDIAAPFEGRPLRFLLPALKKLISPRTMRILFERFFGKQTAPRLLPGSPKVPGTHCKFEGKIPFMYCKVNIVRLKFYVNMILRGLMLPYLCQHRRILNRSCLGPICQHRQILNRSCFQGFKRAGLQQL